MSEHPSRLIVDDPCLDWREIVVVSMILPRVVEDVPAGPVRDELLELVSRLRAACDRTITIRGDVA